MKLRDVAMLILTGGVAALLIFFSPEAKQGAEEGLILSQHTIVPSLLPLLIIFLIVMKSGARDVLAMLFGRVVNRVLNLPYVASPAIIFGLIGGYPTGALMTKELFDNEEISTSQAKRMMCFNFCGGCGFIITAIGSCRLGNHYAGVMLFASNALASMIIGFALSFTEKRSKESFCSFAVKKDSEDIINSATSSAVSSVLGITAIIMLFSAFMKLVPLGDYIKPAFEITSGLCGDFNIPLVAMSAYLSFGGICIHIQLLGTIKQLGMKYYTFLFFRLISAGLSALIMKLLLIVFPICLSVASVSSERINFTSANYMLSVLMVIGCFVIVPDLKSKKLKI